MEILKPLVIFCAILLGGYYLFNYIKDEKGIGFKTIDTVYDVGIKEYSRDRATLTMKKNGTYTLLACGVATGTYEFIDNIYNFKIGGRDASGYTCEGDMREIESGFRGKFRSEYLGGEKIKLDNDNSVEFYLEKHIDVKN